MKYTNTRRGTQSNENRVGQVLPNNKISSHAEKVLFSISTVEKTQGRDPEQKPIRMTPNLNNAPSSVPTGHLPPHGEAANFNAPSIWRERAECTSPGVRRDIKGQVLNKNDFRAPLRSGFTLIELLVVVLIIGILAAVALPQYQTAVRKARFIQMRVVAENLAKGINVYYAANGAWPDRLSQLDIGLPPNLDFGDMRLSTGSGTGRCKETSEMYCCVTLPKLRSQQGSITCGDKNYSFAYAISYANDDDSPLWTRYCKEKHGLQINLCKTLPHTRTISNGSGMRTPAGSVKYDGVEL